MIASPVKSLTLKQTRESSTLDTQSESLSSIVEKQKWEIADLKQEKMGLVQKLRRYKVKGNIIERQKNEIVRLNKYIQKQIDKNSQRAALPTSPVRMANTIIGVTNTSSAGKGENANATKLVGKVLRKNARLKGLNQGNF